MSISQAVVGLTFEAVRKLGEQNDIMRPPYGLLIEWLGVSEQIKNRNKFIDRRCVDLVNFFTKAGFCSCILKGQGNDIAIPVQEHSQIVIDICLCALGFAASLVEEIVRKLLEIQYRLRYFQTIGIDSTVRVLSQAEFLCKKRNSLCESRHGLNGLVQIGV